MQSPTQIAEKIKYLAEHPEVRKKMGEQNRKDYLEKFTENKMIGKFKDCFNKIIGA